MALTRCLSYHALFEIVSDNKQSSEDKIKTIKNAFDEAQDIHFNIFNGKYFLTFDLKEDFNNNREMYEAFIARTGSLAVNISGYNGWTLLGAAAEEGDLGVVKWLVEEQDARINVGETDYGRSALFIAAASGQVEIIHYLLSKGADINRPTRSSPASHEFKSNETPLSIALNSNQLDAVKILIDKGADLKNLNDKQKEKIKPILQILQKEFETTKNTFYSLSDPKTPNVFNKIRQDPICDDKAFESIFEFLKPRF